VIDGSPFQSLSGDKLTTASRQGDKTTTSCDQTRQSRTDDGARDIYGGKQPVHFAVNTIGEEERVFGLPPLLLTLPLPKPRNQRPPGMWLPTSMR
jgi:hypothetical protein